MSTEQIPSTVSAGHGRLNVFGKMLLAAVACGLSLAGCGGDDAGSQSQAQPGPAAAHEPQAAPSRGGTNPFLYRFTAENADEVKARLGVQYRSVLAIPGRDSETEGTPTASYTSSTVRVPEQGWLDVGIGLIPVEGEPVSAVTFAVSIESGGASEEVFSRELSTGDFANLLESHWVDERVDLSQWAGQEVRFGFFASAAGAPYPGARWAAPILYSSVARTADAPPNILVISLDTLRADRLGCYGYSHDTSPNLDRLAKESFVFEECIAPSSWTLPSHATLFTGLPPALHGAYVFSAPVLRKSHTTLSEVARDAGYATVAFTEGAYVGGPLGFYQGFDLYSNGRQAGPSPRGDAKTTFGIAGDWLERNSDRPFMMFLHTYQIHWPHLPPEPYANKFTSSPVDPVQFFHEIRENDFNGNSFLVITKDPGKRQIVNDLYDAGIAYTDALLGELFAHMEKLGLMENTLVVVLSDHGEGFWEHGLASHGTTLYREVLHVPLIVRLPGQNPRSGRIPNLVTLADVFPTVLEWMGVEREAQHDAYNLNSLMTGGLPSIPREFVTAHLNQEQMNLLMVSVQNSQGRYIATTDYTQPESPLHGTSAMNGLLAPGSREAKLMEHIVTGGRDWWTALSDDETRGKMLRSAREEIFMYPGDRPELSDQSLADPLAAIPFRESLSKETNIWKTLGESLKSAEALRPLSEEEKSELRALGYIN